MKSDRILQFGEFRLDPFNRLLQRNETIILLNRRAFDVLLYLVRRPGQMISKNELIKNVWTDACVENNSLTQSISAIRRALEEKPGENSYIATVPGQGYQFVLQVTQTSGSSLDTEDVPPQTTGRIVFQRSTVTTSKVSEEQKRRRSPLNLNRTGVLSITCMLVLVGLVFYKVWRPLHPRPTEATIVIAEFLNATGDPTFDHVLHRALEIDLGQSPYMDVMSERSILTELQLMGKAADATMTDELARQVCERDNRQAVLSGTIADIGRKYLLTLEATACSTGEKLASAKAEASSKEEVLNALDTIADHVRSKLGESAKSVADFHVPIAQVTTPSLEALKAYSLGRYLDAQGKSATEALFSYQQAVVLDPNFAIAYGEIATHYYNLNEYRLASQFYKKALDLSDHVGAKEQFIIRAHYYGEGIGDRLLGIKTYQVWAATYPLEWVPWVDIANQYTQLGEYEPAIEAGKQALQRAHNYSTYIVLARAYKRAGRFVDAKHIAFQALQGGKDSESMHALLYEIAAAEHDPVSMAREVTWSESHPGWYFIDYQANAAGIAGDYKHAKDLFAQSYASAQRAELTEAADDVLEDQATLELQFGLTASAKATLARITTSNRDSGDEAILHAAIGDRVFAERFFAAKNKESSSDTDLTYILLPQLHAELAMNQNKPLLALTALEPSTPYDLSSYDIMSLRGAAYLKAGQAANAAQQYRKVLANPGINGISALYLLAHLGLARSLAMAGDIVGSRAEYATFFNLWKDADQDLPILKAAKNEFSALSTY